MGDDTWNTIYADAFAEDMRFPYDSFNVEDLQLYNARAYLNITISEHLRHLSYAIHKPSHTYGMLSCDSTE